MFKTIAVLVIAGAIVLGTIVMAYAGEYSDYNIPEKKIVPTLNDPNLKPQIIHAGLSFPTKFTFIDDSTILIAQKNDGKILVIKNFELQDEPALDLNVEADWERGLTGLASIKYNEKYFVFVYYTESASSDDTMVPGIERDGNKNNGNKLVRYIWDGTKLVDPVVILHPFPYSGPIHHGGAMAFQNNTLFLGIGDNTHHGILTNGKDETVYENAVIFRVDLDGEAIPSNPFSGNFSKYYALGIRNIYGLAVDPLTQNLWDTENGPKNWDELNLVFPGFNSGWNKIMGPQNISKITSDISSLTTLEGSKYSDPEFSWNDTIGITELEFFESKKFGNDYENDLFVGDVKGHIFHFELNELRDGVVLTEPMLQDYVVNNKAEDRPIRFGENFGVITDMKTGPDGYLYLASLYQSEKMEWKKIEKHWKSDKFFELADLTGVLFRIVPNSISIDEIYKIPPPKKQIAAGIHLIGIKCNEGFELIFKTTDNSPACVTPLTATKLIERGWGK